MSTIPGSFPASSADGRPGPARPRAREREESFASAFQAWMPPSIPAPPRAADPPADRSGSEAPEAEAEPTPSSEAPHHRKAAGHAGPAGVPASLMALAPGLAIAMEAREGHEAPGTQGRSDPRGWALGHLRPGAVATDAEGPEGTIRDPKVPPPAAPAAEGATASDTPVPVPRLMVPIVGGADPAPTTGDSATPVGSRSDLAPLEGGRASGGPGRESADDANDSSRRPGSETALLRASRRTARLPVATIDTGTPAFARLDGAGSGTAPPAAPAAEPALPIPGESAAMRAWEARLSGTSPSLEAPALRFTDPDGSTGTLRLRVRGDSVVATLQTSDATMAGRLERELPGLQQSLRDRGIENARVHLAAAARDSSATNDSREDSSDPSRQSPERPPKRDAETRQSLRQRSPGR